MQIIYDVVNKKDNVLLFSFIFYDKKVAEELIKKLSKKDKRLNFVLRSS